jgi:hypothetical protein
MRRALLVAVVLVVVGAGCSDDPKSAASTATSFPSGVCASISRWQHDIVDAANAFTDDSPHLREDGRRARYLFAFDEQTRLTNTLRDDIQQVTPAGVDDPDAVRAALLAAVDDVEANIADQKADAAEHVDFRVIGPKPDRLFAGTEKSLSLMLKPLDELSRDQHIDELGGSCGR